MNRKLRIRHRRMAFAMAVVLPVGLVVALLAREPVPASTSPRAPVRPVLELGELIWESPEALAPLPVTTRLGRGAGAGVVLELVPRKDPQVPDLLAYWATAEVAPDTLPDDAVLLGRLFGTRPARFALPGRGAGRSEVLVLYSLAHARVVASTALQRGGGDR